MVTIKQIAELCGVSRGTVDRVLNGRGKVRPEKAALVRAMAEKLNYRPNPAGKALSARRTHPVVGVLIASEGVHFFDEVLDAMHHRAQKYAEFGLKVLWRSMRGFDAAEQCRILDELMPKVNALIVNPLSERRLELLLRLIRTILRPRLPHILGDDRTLLRAGNQIVKHKMSPCDEK